ncbi:PilZ domain-containing protein [Maridesulfovibrio sp.]|uniref:PilZ domain-containing protein n=1 Tax=Maridesulfovibrio sp. TaxID=2795000 RepID=UPI002A18D3D0|nr:PilZ domain-containing protein [Maridesulfovibrio sp.]
MDNLDFSRIMDTLNTTVIDPALKFLNSMPPDAMPLILGAAGCIALLAAALVYLVLRPATPKDTIRQKKPQDLNSFFKKSGTIMDLAVYGNNENVIGRAVVTRANEEGIRLEIIDDTGISKMSAPAELSLLFAPEQFGAVRINSFKAQIQNLECGSDGCGRMTMSPPSEFALVKRRRHKRKRVIDQQFIRVKIWRGTPEGDETTFADAAPDLAVNSYDPRATGHENNHVINISNGGIGVSAHEALIHKKFSINDDVLINIFMFNFRQKIFKPYWYAGKIRSIEELDGTSYRVGVQFTMHGTIRDETEQHIDWAEI